MGFELMPVKAQQDVDLQALCTTPVAMPVRASSCLIRHVMDGRAVDVNFWDLQRGQGVNVNVPHSDGKGVSWIVEEISTPPKRMSWEQPGLALTPTLDLPAGGLPAGAVFLMQPAANRDYCLSVR